MMSCQNREIRYHKFTVLILKYGIDDFTDPGLLKIQLTLTGCCGFAFTNVPCIFPFSPNAWFNFTCYHSPRATPRTTPALRARGWGIV